MPSAFAMLEGRSRRRPRLLAGHRGRRFLAGRAVVVRQGLNRHEGREV